jgi:hypothetical protein
LSPQKQNTANNALETLTKRVAHIGSLSIRPVDDRLEGKSLMKTLRSDHHLSLLFGTLRLP